MCGRYFFDLDSEELRALYKKIQEQARREEALAEKISIASGEVFPSNHVVTLQANEEGEIIPIRTRWGFQGFKKGQLMINARSESVEQKKTFAKPFQIARCVFPMSGFYEWNNAKEKHYFSTDEVLYVAGFCRKHKTDNSIETESIIMTTDPNASVKLIHDRMPLIVKRSQVSDWILNLEFARDLIHSEMPNLKSEIVS